MDFDSHARDRIPISSADEQYRALLTLVSLDDSALPVEGAATVHELIDMLGLTDRANELRVERGMRVPSRRSVTAGVPRDSYGRLRTDMVSSPAPDIEDAAEAEPEAVAGASRRHGDNGKCAAGDHPWIPENIRRNEETGRQRCRPCEQRRRRRPTKPKDPNAPVLCGCPGKKHVLTAGDSETTYVDARGKRHCKVEIGRREQAERLALSRSTDTEAA